MCCDRIFEVVEEHERENLRNVVFNYFKEYVSRGGVNEYELVKNCQEIYVRKYEKDPCEYLFGGSIAGLTPWDDYKGWMECEIEDFLRILYEQCPWIGKRNYGTGPVYFVTVNHSGGYYSYVGKTVDEPDIDMELLRELTFKVLKRQIGSRSVFCLPKRNLLDKRAVNKKFVSLGRLSYRISKGYITARNLCMDCLFDRRGYWDLRDRIKTAIAEFLKDITEKEKFIEPSSYGYDLHYCLKPKKNTLDKFFK